jgi:hypothetical protein
LSWEEYESKFFFDLEDEEKLYGSEKSEEEFEFEFEFDLR